MTSENSSTQKVSDGLPVRGNGKCIFDEITKKADEDNVLKKSKKKTNIPIEIIFKSWNKQTYKVL